MKVSGVSFSSDKKLSKCEMQYSYRYDQKLRLKTKKSGLFMGDWMHQFLEEYRRGNDWLKKFKEFKKVWAKLFDEEREMYGQDFPDRLHSLMSHYVEHWAEQQKRWVAIEIEKDYELMTKYGWPIRWKSDYLVREGKLVILVENKNKKDMPEANERMLAPQPHSYCYLLSKVGIKVDRILWDYVRTEPVPEPKVNKDGSLSKKKINTDRRTFLRVLERSGIDPKKYKGHIDILPDTLSLMRVTNVPNLKVGEMFVRDWVERAHRAESIKRPTRNWQSDCRWMCDYYHLCQADMLGNVDRDMIIKKDFVPLKELTQ